MSFLSASWLLCAAGTSSGHTLLVSPTPRDQIDAHKDSNGGAPCGGVARTAMSTNYSVGQKVTVSWTETVDHPGCFLIDLSAAGDQNFQMLANVKHVATGTTPRPYSTQITLPAGMSCPACTMRIRQIMLADDVQACPPATIPLNATYYSCADVAITNTPQPDMAQPDMATKSPDLSQGSMGGGAQATGCSAVPGAADRTAPLALSAAGLGLAVLLRSRRRLQRAR